MTFKTSKFRASLKKNKKEDLAVTGSHVHTTTIGWGCMPAAPWERWGCGSTLPGSPPHSSSYLPHSWRHLSLWCPPPTLQQRNRTRRLQDLKKKKKKTDKEKTQPISLGKNVNVLDSKKQCFSVSYTWVLWQRNFKVTNILAQMLSTWSTFSILAHG